MIHEMKNETMKKKNIKNVKWMLNTFEMISEPLRETMKWKKKNLRSIYIFT